MARKIVDAIKRVFDDPHQTQGPHFHAVHPDSPEVCYDADCGRPRLSV